MLKEIFGSNGEQHSYKLPAWHANQYHGYGFGDNISPIMVILQTVPSIMQLAPSRVGLVECYQLTYNMPP
jgi:hypothetical protein